MDPLSGSLFLENGYLGLYVGRLNISDEAPFKSRRKTFLKIWNISRKLITGYDDLFSVFIEGIKDVKKLGLSPLLSCNELNVIDEKDVHPPEAISEFVHPLIPNGVDQLIGEVL